MTEHLPESAPNRQDEQYTELSRHLRTLALRLVHEESSADDLVQEAWLAALDQPPSRVRNINAWLRQVVFNTARRSYRNSKRRREIEAFTAPDESIDEEPEFVVRSTHAMLRETVAELRDPYRTALILRYFDELSVKEIAERVGHSPATVRSQIKRGLDQMREVLDRRHSGKRNTWALLMWRFASAESDAAVPPPVAHATSFQSLALAVACSAAVLLPVWFTIRGGDAGPLAGEAPGPRAIADSEASPEPELASVRTPATSPRRAESAPSAPVASALRRVEVEVSRADGTRPIGGRVIARGRDRRVVADLATDIDGRAVIEVAEDLLLGSPTFPAGQFGLAIDARDRDEAWSHVTHVTVPAEGARVEVRTRGPAQGLRVLVVNEQGDPVPFASVMLGGTASDRFAPEDGKPIQDVPGYYRADADGVMLLMGLPRKLHRVEVTAVGYRAVEAFLQGAGEMVSGTVRLDHGFRVHGVVRLADGTPAAGARIWKSDPTRRLAGQAVQEVVADASGAFELAGLPPGPQHLMAVAADDLGTSANGHVVIAKGARWDPTLESRGTLEVRTLNKDGEPLRDVVVVIGLDAQPRWNDSRVTGADGRAVFFATPDGALDLSVQAHDPRYLPVQRSGLTQRDTALEITLLDRPPPGSVQGIALDLDGNAFPDATFVGAGGTRVAVPIHTSSGEYRATRLPPGEYAFAVKVREQGAFSLGVHTVQPGADYRLALTRLPLPTLVEFYWNQNVPSPNQLWELRSTLDAMAHDESRVFVFDEEALAFELLPGRYRLGPIGDDGQGIEFEVPQTDFVSVEIP